MSTDISPNMLTDMCLSSFALAMYMCRQNLSALGNNYTTYLVVHNDVTSIFPIS